MAGGNDTSLVVCTSFAFASVLLIIGHLIRARVWALRRIFLPASLIGGLIGLIIVQLFLNLPDPDTRTQAHVFVEEQMLNGWDDLPALLIAIVFACLFLGSPIPGIRRVWQIAGPQLVYGQILAWGQYGFPMLVTGAILIKAFDVNPLIGAVVALGFEGGHGTAAALRDTFDENDYPQGSALSLCAATIGLLSGLLYGTLLINWAVSKGFVIKEKLDTGIQGVTGSLFNGVYPPDKRPSAGKQTISVESMDTLGFHLSIVGLALLIGTLFKRALTAMQGLSPFLEDTKFFSGFPLFPFTMFGGIMIQIFADRTASPGYIDRGMMDRISGFALDFTIVTAITTMRLDGLGSEVPPFLILIVVAWIWHFVCFFFLAPWLLPDFWVERAVAELGQSMGITATGLLLLRMCDPQNKTPALNAFSYKQLLHEPVVGGGLWTALVIPFVKHVGLWPATGLCFGVVAMWFLVHYFVFHRQKHSVGSPTIGPTESKGASLESAPLLGHNVDNKPQQGGRSGTFDSVA